MIRPGFIHNKNLFVLYQTSREEPPATRHCLWHTPCRGIDLVLPCGAEYGTELKMRGLTHVPTPPSPPKPRNRDPVFFLGIPSVYCTQKRSSPGGQGVLQKRLRQPFPNPPFSVGSLPNSSVPGSLQGLSGNCKGSSSLGSQPPR